MTSRPPERQIDSWRAAEENAASWMRHFGFRSVRLTAQGADGGVDVRAQDAIAQVKFEAQLVGRPQLQNLVGARGRDHDLQLLFFTGAGYAKTALEYADQMAIALFRYQLDGTVQPVNGTASVVASNARRQDPGPAREMTIAAASRVRAVIGATVGRVPGGTVTVWLLAVGLSCTWGFAGGLLRNDNYSADGLKGGAVVLLLAVAGWALGVRRWRRHRVIDESLNVAQLDD